ncbi:MAG TPA: alanine--glyoxylate aminotransferase family protein [Vicinamibacteria bacterium]|nr:alanine--glyoxylate aminotransferase family protein [Vicinamibacteria bacterium]
MIQKQRLFTPGPTPLHPDVQQAMGRPILHHRTDEFRAVFAQCVSGLKGFLKTSDDVLILACSGTGGMEAALVNVLSPGDRMLALVAGSFGERWAAIGRGHGMDVKELRAGWGEAVAPEEVARALDADPGIRAVFVQLNESSTGAAHDVQALARVTRARPDTLLVVDAISGAGALPLETEAWGLDVVVVGSQKALALPPGLAFLSVGARAWARIESAKAPRFYFDLRRERKAQKGGESAFTPAISSVLALRAALEAVENGGGVDALVDNAATLAALTRAAAQALGLPLVAPRAHGDALTALYPPPGLESGPIVKGLKSEFGSTVAGGQGELKGKILRIAHLGYYDATDIFGLLATLEIVLRRLGHAFEAGRGLAAAEDAYLRRVSR